MVSLGDMLVLTVLAENETIELAAVDCTICAEGGVGSMEPSCSRMLLSEFDVAEELRRKERSLLSSLATRGTGMLDAEGNLFVEAVTSARACCRMSAEPPMEATSTTICGGAPTAALVFMATTADETGAGSTTNTNSSLATAVDITETADGEEDRKFRLSPSPRSSNWSFYVTWSSCA